MLEKADSFLAPPAPTWRLLFCFMEVFARRDRDMGVDSSLDWVRRIIFFWTLVDPLRALEFLSLTFESKVVDIF